MNVQLILSAFEAQKKIEIIKMPFLVKTKPNIDISFDSKNAEPHNTPTHVIYHRDLDAGSILIYWHTLIPCGTAKILSARQPLNLLFIIIVVRRISIPLPFIRS